MEKIKTRCLLLLLCIHTAAWSQTHFTDVTATAGIHHVFKVHEGMFGGGACVIDFNNDGLKIYTSPVIRMTMYCIRITEMAPSPMYLRSRV